MNDESSLFVDDDSLLVSIDYLVVFLPDDEGERGIRLLWTGYTSLHALRQVDGGRKTYADAQANKRRQEERQRQDTGVSNEAYNGGGQSSPDERRAMLRSGHVIHVTRRRVLIVTPSCPPPPGNSEQNEGVRFSREATNDGMISPARHSLE